LRAMTASDTIPDGYRIAVLEGLVKIRQGLVLAARRP